MPGNYSILIQGNHVSYLIDITMLILVRLSLNLVHASKYKGACRKALIKQIAKQRAAEAASNRSELHN